MATLTSNYSINAPFQSATGDVRKEGAELTITRPVFTTSGSATTTYAALNYAGITDPLMIVLINEDATNNLLVSLDSGSTTHLTIPPGHCQPLHVPGNNVQVKSSASTVAYTSAIAK